MSLADLISLDSILPCLKVGSKKQALADLSERAAALCSLPERTVFDALIQRERLGSTGIGAGVAIPHGKLAKVDRIFGLFARLERPIEYDSLDGMPVDLIFLLIAPETAGADHLKALARMARALRNSNLTERLREATTAAALYALLSEPDPSLTREG